MKLNRECIRDLLLFVEQSDMGTILQQELLDFAEEKDYTPDELAYTIEKLEEAKYLNAEVWMDMSENFVISIDSITYNGHQFLDTIRDDSVWKHVKSKSSQFASVSIPILSQLGLSYIKDSLGLQ